MELLIYISLSISILVNVFLVYRGIRLIQTIQMLIDKNTFDRQYVFRTLTHMLSTMRDIDIKGSFESDDEVGSVFDELKQTIQKYKENI